MLKEKKPPTFSVLIVCACSGPPHASTCPFPLGGCTCVQSPFVLPLNFSRAVPAGCGTAVAGMGRAQGQPCPLSEEGAHPRAPAPPIAWG